MSDKSIATTISLIIPAYNAGKTIERCLESVLSQKSIYFETILVDDGSIDDTLNKASIYPVKIISNKTNKGVAYSRNIGAMNATGDILIFLDSDVSLPDDAVFNITKTTLEKPEVLIVQSNYSENTSHLNFISDYKNLDLVYRGFFSPDYTKYISGFFFAIKRSIFEQSGGFCIDLLYVEDIEFGNRVCKGRELAFQNRTIKVDHLKTYTLISLLRTNYYRIMGMMKIIKLTKGNINYTSNTATPYLINIILPCILLISFLAYVLSYISLFFTLIIYIIILGIFIINNRGFLLFTLKKRGLTFSLKSIVVLFVEYFAVVISIGISNLIFLIGLHKKQME